MQALLELAKRPITNEITNYFAILWALVYSLGIALVSELNKLNTKVFTSKLILVVNTGCECVSI